MNIGINYTEIKKGIALVLESIYKDFKKDGVIYTLTKYEGQHMSRTYLRKLADIGILNRLTASKKNMQYEWNAGDHPNFVELTNRVLTETKIKSTIKDTTPNKNYNLDSTKVALLLAKNGIEEDRIPDLTFDIMKIFYP